MAHRYLILQKYILIFLLVGVLFIWMGVRFTMVRHGRSRQPERPPSISELTLKQGTFLGYLQFNDGSAIKTIEMLKPKAPVIIAFTRSVDCPSCVELVISEFNAIALEPSLDRHAFSVVLGVLDDSGHYFEHIKMRYSVAFTTLRVLNYDRDSIISNTGTPQVAFLNSAHKVMTSHLAVPGRYKEAQTFVDTLRSRLLGEEYGVE